MKQDVRRSELVFLEDAVADYDAFVRATEDISCAEVLVLEAEAERYVGGCGERVGTYGSRDRRGPAPATRTTARHRA